MLEVVHLAKKFGAVQALQDVSLSLAAGEIRAVCGENGAGKSTLMKLLMGIERPDSGSIRLDGADVSIGSPLDAQRLGLALVAQELSLAPHLSILDNIWLGDRTVPLLHRRRRFRHEAAAALRQLGVDYDLDRELSTLSVGQRQIVEIARLLVRNARILILDEPTATLSDVEIAHLMTAVRQLKAQGKSILYVTHRLGEVFDICDSVTVLRNGADVSSFATGDVDRRQLIEAMLGKSFQNLYPNRETQRQSGGLEIVNLTVPGIVDRFSVTARRGEITTIAGQVGAGAAHVTRAVAGLVADASGRVALDGKPLALTRQKRDFHFVSEDRASEGVFHRDVLENLVASRLSGLSPFGVVRWGRVRSFATKLCGEVKVDTSRLGTYAFNLSGGNQQKLLFARALGADQPGVLLINEPTRGVDVGARAEIYRILREFCALGYVLLVTSSDLEEVVGISDRIITMYRGKIVSSYDNTSLTSGDILGDITHPPAAVS